MTTPDAPNVIVERLKCPVMMQLNDTEVVTAVISRSTGSQQTVALGSSGFAIDPGEPVEVSIPGDEEVEVTWRITAQKLGIHSLTIPLNQWEDHNCMVRVVDTLWLNYRESRILSLFSMLVGSLLVIPRRGISAIEINIQSLKDFLLFAVTFTPVTAAILLVALIASTLSTTQAIVLAVITVLSSVLWFVPWFAKTWGFNIPTKTKKLLLTGSFIFALLFEYLYLMVALGDTYKPLPSGIFMWLFIPATSILLIWPWFDRLWDHPWEETSKISRRVRALLFMVATPLMTVAFLSALSESLLLFF
jgi:hypothetical protein